MQIVRLLLSFASFRLACSSSLSTSGVEALLQRRLPNHVNDFVFNIDPDLRTSNGSKLDHDGYTVQSSADGKIDITGNTASALSSGLHWYLAQIAHVDIFWFIGSQLKDAPRTLPKLNDTHHGKSTIPWRYHFNTVTFSYTSAFWDWTDWELQLDWMALRGINIALAWNGYEYILAEVLREAGFSDAALTSFLSGPSFQAWNRLGNIQGSWGGDLPRSWITQQLELNKRIVSRMVELGIVPVLPAFTGFLPTEIAGLYPDAAFVNGSAWEGFPSRFTNVTFLEPFDPLFTSLQKSFLSKQRDVYGNVTSIYALDQYNENNPFSGDLDYLRNVTLNTIKSLKAADANAIWMLQGWLFYSSQSFWTNERIEAYLGSVNNSDMLILDLFSESQPQWQRTNSYFGKPWIWCQLHDYGGNIGLYGQVENVTINPVAALNNQSASMVGMGLTMEGQAGGEIMYDLLLDQAWSAKAIDTESYFRHWVTTRYSGNGEALPSGPYNAWDIMRQTVYNNTNLSLAQATTKSIFELSPNTTGLLNRTGHHPTTITYEPKALVKAWQEIYNASSNRDSESLWQNSAYRFDLTDITRQVLANAFYPLYSDFVKYSNRSLASSYSPQTAARIGDEMIALLVDLDAVLAASDEDHFSLNAWLSSARSWAYSHQTAPEWKKPPGRHGEGTNSTCDPPGPATIADFYEYDARNQVTLWGPSGEINNYASKQWAGLIGTYYVENWKRFISFTLNSTTTATGGNDGLAASLLTFAEGWQNERLHPSWGKWPPNNSGRASQGLKFAIEMVVEKWPNVFGI